MQRGYRLDVGAELFEIVDRRKGTHREMVRPISPRLVAWPRSGAAGLFETEIILIRGGPWQARGGTRKDQNIFSLVHGVSSAV
jgi:hypothetical protein